MLARVGIQVTRRAMPSRCYSRAARRWSSVSLVAGEAERGRLVAAEALLATYTAAKGMRDGEPGALLPIPK